jgi:hypothetical protein
LTGVHNWNVSSKRCAIRVASATSAMRGLHPGDLSFCVGGTGITFEDGLKFLPRPPHFSSRFQDGRFSTCDFQEGTRNVGSMSRFPEWRNSQPGPAASMLTEHPYVGPGRPKESVQNVRARAIIAAIAPKSGPNRDWLSANIRCRTCIAQHMGRLGLSEHSKCVARVRAPIVARFVARYSRRCLADRVISA